MVKMILYGVAYVVAFLGVGYGIGYLFDRPIAGLIVGAIVMIAVTGVLVWYIDNVFGGWR